MDMKGFMLSELSQRKTRTVWYHWCVGSEKYHKWVRETKRRNKLTDTEKKPVVIDGKGEGQYGAGEW